MAPAKIPSPQYLIWLIPFCSVLDGDTERWGRWVLLPCCAAMVLVSPFRYRDLAALDSLTIGILNLRNMLLIVLLFLLTFGPETLAAGGPYGHRRAGR